MMKSIMKHMSLILLSTIFTSCVKYVDLEHLRPDPKLVLNSVAQPNVPLTATVSRTWFYTDNYPNVTIEDARVSLYVNGQYVEDMSWYEEESEYNSVGYYRSAYKPSEGDKLRLEVRKQGFGDVSAECVVPVKPELLKLEAVEEQYTASYGSALRRTVYRTTFKDRPQADDCYMIRLMRGYPVSDYNPETGEETFTGEYSWTDLAVNYTDEPIFKNKVTALDEIFGNDWLSGYRGRPFSDELINGREYTLKLTDYGVYSPYSLGPVQRDSVPPTYAKVYLYTLSEPYYQYLMALAELADGSLNNDLVGAGLAEPVRVSSNVVGGTGIFGAATVDTLTVETPRPY